MKLLLLFFKMAGVFYKIIVVLVIETTGADEYGSFYDKYTYTRMAE